ncbi:MAG: hypothetical protein ABW252_20745 [Polyangiales bacterium]
MKVALSAVLCFALGACFGGMVTPATASADDRPGHARRAEVQREKREKRAKRIKHPKRTREPRPKDRGTRSERARLATRTRAPSPPEASASGAGSDEIVREGETSVKVMRFSGLDIEGRLKSPQLVVFVERVRAEFEHPALPHRSFMPELRDTAAREPVR